MYCIRTAHISVHMHISYVLGYVLRGGTGGGIGLEMIVSVCNIIGHQEVVLWAPIFPTHLDPPSSYHQLVEEWGWGRLHLCGVYLCTLALLQFLPPPPTLIIQFTVPSHLRYYEYE